MNLKFLLFNVSLLLITFSALAYDDLQLNKLINQSSKTITLPKKNFTIGSKLIIPKNKIINGNGASILFANVLKTDWQIEILDNTTLKNITIQPLVKNNETNFQLNGIEAYKKFNFQYATDLKGVLLNGNGVVLNKVKILGTSTAIGSNKQNILLQEVYAEGAYASVDFYTSSHIKILNSTFYGGDFACIGMPSCHDILVSGCKLYNPKSTGVNPGGATLESLVASKIVVKNNYIIAGDCINLENGAIDAEIYYNEVYCAPLLDKYINNNAIGVQTHDAGANGVIRNINIHNNKIYAYMGALYAIGINVGNTVGNSVSNITISNNTISGGNEGIRIHNATNFSVQQVNIIKNTVNCEFKGILTLNTQSGTITDNDIYSNNSTWNHNLWGVQINNCSNLTFKNNTTTGFDKHYSQTDKCYNVIIDSPKIKQGKLNRSEENIYTDPNISTSNKIIIKGTK